MSTNPVIQHLPRIFQAAAAALQVRRSELNQADPYNGNHGDHMVEIFHVAAQSAEQVQAQDIAGAMQQASQSLRLLTENGSAQVYAQGLDAFARMLDSYQVSLDDLAAYVQHLLAMKEVGEPQPAHGDVLKALLAGLSGWRQAASGAAESGGFGIGDLFELGMVYLQAKQRNPSMLETVADAAVSASPLAQVPHRAESGKIALSALLQALIAV